MRSAADPALLLLAASGLRRVLPGPPASSERAFRETDLVE
jgi:hypothetical protein